MKNLELYLDSLTKNARAKVDAIINNNNIASNTFIEGNVSYIPIEYNPKENFDVVEPRDLNMVMSDIEYSHRKMWNTISIVDSSVRSLSKRVSDSLSVLTSSNNKITNIYDDLIDNIGKNYKYNYVESFNDYSGTDSDQTNAIILNGSLIMDSVDSETVMENWSLELINVPGTKSEKRTISFGYNAQFPITNITNGLYIKATKYFDTPTILNGISFVSSSDCVIEKIVIKDSVDSVHTIIEDVAVKIGHNKLLFDKKYTCSLIRLYLIQPIYNSITIPEKNMYLFETDEFNTYMFNSTAENTIRMRNKESSNFVNKNSLRYIICLDDIKYITSTIVTSSTWISEPVIINSNINNITLDINGENGLYGNVSWYGSVNAGQYIPIAADQYIENELLVFDTTGIAKLIYPIDNDKSIVLSEEIGYELLLDNDGFASIYIESVPQKKIGCSYYTTYTGFVKLDELSSIASSSVVEAIFDNKKGQRFSSTSNRQVILKYIPIGDITVYSNSIKCIELPYDKSFDDYASDTTSSYIIYYKVSGNRILFSSEVDNITVFYYYNQSSLRLKAILTTINNYFGNGPKVNQVNISIGG